ncbi:MAG: hypothetical protein HKN20_02120 [Gemmatimonadetes bacterium]|nr:hypothetical protein [Gemmatimonadota bacterium]
MKHARGFALLALILIVAAGLRLWNLDAESLWLDEIHTHGLMQISIGEMLSTNGNHTPLFFLIEHKWVEFFGTSDFSMRFPSFIFSVLAIGAAFFATRRLTDHGTAILTALILTVTAFHIHYAQDARPYALLALVTALALLAFVRFLERPTILNSTLLVLANVLALYSHFYGIFMIFAQNAYVLAIHFGGSRLPRRAEKPGSSSKEAETDLPAPGLLRWFILQAVIALLFFPWIINLVNDVQTHKDKRPDYPPPALRKLIGPFITYSGTHVQFLLYGLLAAVPVLKRFGPRIVLLLLWLFVPIVVPFVGAHLFMPQAFITRYTIGSSLAFYILVAWGIRLLPSPRFRAGAIAVVLLLAAADLRTYYTTENRAPWREATATIAERYEARDLMIMHSGLPRGPFLHYWPGDAPRLVPFPPEGTFYFTGLLDSLEEAVEKEPRFWYVESYSRDPKGLITEVMAKNHDLVYEKRWDTVNSAMGKTVSIAARLYERRTGAGGTTGAPDTTDGSDGPDTEGGAP